MFVEDFMQEVLNYLYGLERFGIKLGLDVVNQLMELLDNPHKKFRSVHIAGTNGKGSTAAFLSSVLQEAGFKVGLYTSPHLIKFNERVRVNGKEISDEEIVSLTKIIRQKTMEKGVQPTFFEFTTAMAFSYFAKQGVDFAVVEVGMGGRLDATNVLQPEVSVITHVGLDHTYHLGDTIYKIAREKAGIIKRNSVLVTAETNKRIISYFKGVCDEKEVRMFVVGEQISSKVTYSGLEGQGFDTTGMVSEHFDIKLLGEHQIENASTSILVARVLGVDMSAIKSGVEKTLWPGRLDVVSKKPLVFVDGAHNIEGMKAVAHFMKYIPNKKILILGIAENKDIDKLVKDVVPLFEQVIITKGNYKPAKTSDIKKEVLHYTTNIKEIPLVADAIKEAFNSVSGNDVVLITGSIYMIGDAMAELNGNVVFQSV